MANFLITSPNSLAQGTDTTDLFVLNTALGATVYGNGGADQISALGTNTTNAKFYGGPGGDSIYLTGATTNGAVAGFFLGNGADLMVASAATLANGTIIGGGGNDTVNLVGAGQTFTDTNVNGNLGSDVISGSGTLLRAFFAGGGDNDTINFNGLAAADASTINGGGGADILFISGGDNFSGGRIDADTLNDSEFFGNDTVTVVSAGFTGSFIQLGGGADVFVMSGNLGTGATIEGGGGLDSISLQLTTAGTFIGGGAGVDTIAISAAGAGVFGTLQGGGGADVINVSGAAYTGGALMGGAAGDAIGLGTIQEDWASGTPVNNAVASGINVAYQSFDQSNLAGLDVISAASVANSGGGVFMVTQSAVTFTGVATGTYGAAGDQFTVGVNNRVTAFSNAATNSLASRATLLDSALGQGAAVVFNAAGSNYLFVQGGAAGSGTGNDLIVQLNVGGFIVSGASGAAAQNVGTGGLFVTNGSAVKIAFTNNGAF